MKKNKLLGNLEQKVMNILWSSNAAMTPRDVLDRLDDGHAYTTIMTIMTTLHDKGLLDRSTQGKGYIYTVCSSKEEFAKKRLSSHFDELLNNFGNLAVAQFVDSLKDDPQNLKALQDAIDKVSSRESK